MVIAKNNPNSERKEKNDERQYANQKLAIEWK